MHASGSSLGLTWLAGIMEGGEGRGSAVVAGSPQPVLAGVQHQQQEGHRSCCTAAAQLHSQPGRQKLLLLLHSHTKRAALPLCLLKSTPTTPPWRQTSQCTGCCTGKQYQHLCPHPLQSGM